MDLPFNLSGVSEPVDLGYGSGFSMPERCLLSLYLEARIQIRIRIKVKGRIRIRIRIKVTSKSRIRIKVTSRIRIRVKVTRIADPQHCSKLYKKNLSG